VVGTILCDDIDWMEVDKEELKYFINGESKTKTYN